MLKQRKNNNGLGLKNIVSIKFMFAGQCFTTFCLTIFDYSYTITTIL